MSTERTSNIRVGLFAAVGLLLMAGGIFLVGGSAEMFEDRYTLFAAWKDVAGLKEGAVVRLAGWDVGEVVSIRFSDDANVQKIFVEMRVRKEFQDRIRQCPKPARPERPAPPPPLPEGATAEEVEAAALAALEEAEELVLERLQSSARIETMGVLGDKYVGLSMGPLHDPRQKTPAQPEGVPCDVLEDGDWIETEEALDVVAYTGKVTEILESVNSIGRKVDLMLGEDQEAAQASLSQSLTHLEGMLREAKEGSGLLHALVYDDRMPKRVDNILANLEGASGGLADVAREIKEGDGIANELVYGENGEELAEELRSLAGALARLTRDIQNEESLINALIYDPDKKQILDDLKLASARLETMSAMLVEGDGTLALLARDPALYEDMRSLVRGAQRNKLLRAYIRQTVSQGERDNASAWEPASDEREE